MAVYIPAPLLTPAAQAGEQLLLGITQDYSMRHPAQGFTVSALYARHYAWEGATALPPGKRESIKGPGTGRAINRCTT